MSREAVVDEILHIYRASEESEYFGEAVSQLAHSLQAAQSARDAGADDELIVASLLHDIGHNIQDSRAVRHSLVGVINHDELGAQWLAERGFSPRLLSLVRGHVDAKRYLVATNPDYAARLSSASTETLSHQGGAMNETEAAAFAASPYFRDCLRLRSWDEQAKDPQRQVTPLDDYRDLILAQLTGM